MTFLLWLAALVGVFIAHGALHTAALIVLIVLSVPLVIVLLGLLGIGALAAKGVTPPRSRKYGR